MSFQLILTLEVVDPVTGALMDGKIVNSGWFRRDRDGIQPPGLADTFIRGLQSTVFPITFLDDDGKEIECSIMVTRGATQVIATRFDNNTKFEDRFVVDLFTEDADDFAEGES